MTSALRGSIVVLEEANMALDLETRDKVFLLRLARQAIERRLAGEPLPEPEVPPGPLTEPRGAFVTLTKGGELRGCIGHVVGIEPLWQSVRDNALNAAFHDPRFPPLDATELPHVEIEVSALTPLRTVASPEDVRVGEHGVMIERGPYRGLLLPQVPIEYGWDRQAFLDHTCRKAGLPAGCWRDPGTRIQVFSAEVFSEAKLLGQR